MIFLPKTTHIALTPSLPVYLNDQEAAEITRVPHIHEIQVLKINIDSSSTISRLLSLVNITASLRRAHISLSLPLSLYSLPIAFLQEKFSNSSGNGSPPSGWNRAIKSFGFHRPT
jgi:hypothetical protein